MYFLLNRLKDFLLSLNLFANDSKYKEIVYCQRLSTWIFLILFFIFSLILLIYLSLSNQMKIIRIKSPSESDIEYIYKNYRSTSNCPCSQISIPQKDLIDHQIDYHQVKSI